jgi:hypothetical protein
MMFMEDQQVPEANGRVVAIRKSYLLVAALGVVAILIGYLLLSGPDTESYIRPYSPVLGNGTINIVEFSDYECPFCQAAEGNNQQSWTNLEAGILLGTCCAKHVSEYVETGKANLIFGLSCPWQHQRGDGILLRPGPGHVLEYHNLLFENYENLTLSDLMGYASDLE